METVIELVFCIGLVLFVMIFGSIEEIHFRRNSFRKKKEPMYKDDRTINRHYKE